MILKYKMQLSGQRGFRVTAYCVDRFMLRK